jgi:hypothetical protein
MSKIKIVLIPFALLLGCYLHSCATSKSSLQSLEDNISVIHLSGSPQEIGAQHGTLLKENIRKLNQDAWDYIDFMASSAKVDIMAKTMIKGILYGTAKKYLPDIPEEYVAEMKALAEASGVGFDDILLANVASEAFMEVESLANTGFCTSIALNNEMTFDGSLFHLYSVDMYAPPKNFPDPESYYKKVRFFDKYKTLYFYRPQKGNSFMTSFVCGFANSFAGMNERGICLSFMGPWKGDKKARGIPLGFQIRSILQYAGSFSEAIEMAKSAKWTLGGYLVISDGSSNQAALVLFGPGKCEITMIDNGKLIKGFGETQASVLLSGREYGGRLTPGSIIKLLRHQPYDWDGVCSKATAYSVVFHPSTKRFWIALGDAPAPANTYYGFDLLSQSRLTEDTENFKAIYPYTADVSPDTAPRPAATQGASQPSSVIKDIQDNRWLIIRLIWFEDKTKEITEMGQELVRSGQPATMDIRSSESGRSVGNLAFTANINPDNTWLVTGKGTIRRKSKDYSISTSTSPACYSGNTGFISRMGHQDDGKWISVWNIVTADFLSDAEAKKLKDSGELPALDKTKGVTKIGVSILEVLRAGKREPDYASLIILCAIRPDGFNGFFREYLAQNLDKLTQPGGRLRHDVGPVYDYWNECGEPEDALILAKIADIEADDCRYMSSSGQYNANGIATMEYMRPLENIGERCRWKGMLGFLQQWLADTRIYVDIEEVTAGRQTKPIAKVFLCDRAVRHIQKLSGEPIESFGLYDIRKQWESEHPVHHPPGVSILVHNPFMVPDVYIFRDQKQREFGVAKAKQYLEANKDRFK